MLLNLYLFTFIQSKAFILPFCIYEPLAREATFFYIVCTRLSLLTWKSFARWIVWIVVCFLPKYYHTGVCCHLHCFGSNQKVLYEKPRELGHVRTCDLAKRSEKFQHIIYKNISKSAPSLYIFYKGKSWGLLAPQSVLMMQEFSCSLFLKSGVVSG